MPFNVNFSSDTLSDVPRYRRQTSIIDSIEGNSYMLTDLLPSTKYKIDLTAINQDGLSSAPDIVYAYTKPADDSCKYTERFLYCRWEAL